jgi:hypothetical protein
VTVLKDFLYIDEVRLDRYAAQINALFGVDYKREKSVELGPEGPKVSISETREVRQTTWHEKIAALEKHLRKNGGWNEKRPLIAQTHEEGKLCFEICRATPILIPPANVDDLVSPVVTNEGEPLVNRKDSNWQLQQAKQRGADAFVQQERIKAERNLTGFGGLRLWYAPYRGISIQEGPPETPLFLLIDDSLARANPRQLSAWSALQAMYDEVPSTFQKTVLIRRSAEFGTATSPFHAEFRSDPVATLNRMGAKIFDERFIHSLYLVRRVAPQPESGPTTIAYPIYVAAGPGELWS